MPQPLMLKKLKLNGSMKNLHDLLELTPKKRCPFQHRELEWKSRKSRDSWSNRQVWPWSTKWIRTKANQVLPRECTDHSKHPLPTTWDNSTDGQYENQIDYRASPPSGAGLPFGSADKESNCNVGDLGSIPRLGRSPGEAKGYPLQYSGLENSMDCIV